MTSYDEKNLPSLYSADDYTEIKEDEINEEKDSGEAEPDKEVYELPASYFDRSRIWSILAVILGTLAIALAPFVYYLSLTFSVVSGVLVGVSRKKFGFFTQMTFTGLITALIGAVAGLSFMTVRLLGLF